MQGCVFIGELFAVMKVPSKEIFQRLLQRLTARPPAMGPRPP